MNKRGMMVAVGIAAAGKEYTDFGGESQSDFHARTLSHPVPLFTTRDPLSRKRPWESPYIFAGANPVMFTDPTGRKVEGDTAVFYDYKRELQRILNAVDNNTKAIQFKDFLSEQLDHLTRLENSSQLYLINKIGGIVGGISYNYENNALNINVVVVSDEHKYENISHELNHAWQFENGEISLTKDNYGILYDIHDEVESFNVTYQLQHGILFYEHNDRQRDSSRNLYRISKRVLKDPNNIFYNTYGKVPNKKRSLDRRTRKKLKRLNSNGVVEYYIGWRDDLK